MVTHRGNGTLQEIEKTPTVARDPHEKRYKHHITKNVPPTPRTTPTQQRIGTHVGPVNARTSIQLTAAMVTGQEPAEWAIMPRQ